MNTAIIVAAGNGTRFGSDIPKQFIEIAGKPLIVHTLERFEACDAIDEIVLVLSEAGIEQFQTSNLGAEIAKLRTIVVGGTTRAGSVKNGLDAIDPTANVVAVHDGARPLVTSQEIEACVTKAVEMGAACLVAAVTDTIKSIRGDEIVATLDRDKLRRALTPQCFKVEVLRAAFENADLTDAVTDECYAVEKLGHPIAFVEGSSRNIKVTTPDDMLFAEAIMRDGRGKF